MTQESLKSKQWLLVGIITGLGAASSYISTIFVPMPILLAYVVFMAFGPLFCVAIVSFYHYIKTTNDTISLSLGTVLLILAGGINTMMAAMQGAIRMYMNDLPAGSLPPLETNRSSILKSPAKVNLPRRN